MMESGLGTSNSMADTMTELWREERGMAQVEEPPGTALRCRIARKCGSRWATNGFASSPTRDAGASVVCATSSSTVHNRPGMTILRS